MGYRFCRYLSLMFFAVACVQTENSSTLDESNYGDSTGSAEFLAARTIFAQNCANGCHGFHGFSEAELIAQGLVIAGNPENSPIYYRIRGSSGSNGSKNMPPSGSLQAADLTAISTWIQNIQ